MPENNEFCRIKRCPLRFFFFFLSTANPSPDALGLCQMIEFSNPFFFVTEYKSNLCSLHHTMHFRLFKSRFADAITFVAILIITKTQFDSKEGKREMILIAMNTCIKFPVKDAPIRLEAWYTLPCSELIMPRGA